MSFIAEPKSRHMPTEGDGFDQFVAVLWIVSEVAFDVFGMFFWSALALFFLKAIS